MKMLKVSFPKSRVKIAHRYLAKLMESNNMSSSCTSMTFDEKGINVLNADEEFSIGDDVNIDYSVESVSWEYAIDAVCTYHSTISTNKFFFDVSGRGSRNVTIVTPDKVYDLPESELAKIVAIENLGHGARAHLDENVESLYYASNVTTTGQLKVQTLKTEDILEASKCLVTNVPIDYFDQLLVVECIINDGLNYTIANFFLDYRLARSHCETYLANNTVRVFKFEIETQERTEIVEHRIDNDKVNKLIAIVNGRSSMDIGIEECIKRHNSDVYNLKNLWSNDRK